ncbi:MAG TPA: FAD binding domain-containing protein [Anaerolineales bacterium]|nr:FAD binding domain-containing protein [Anaerolineales bacterium]
MWTQYINATSLDEVIDLLARHRERARIVAGATDLILEVERGVRKGIDLWIDITRIRGLDRIVLDEDQVIHLGPLVTHNHCVGSKLLVEQAFPLAQAAWELGAPQIRNRGTVAGNLITASPANDTITPLMALGAKVTLLSKAGRRDVPLAEFYTGVRGTVMRPDEMMVDIAFPAMQRDQRGTFVKLGLRRAQAISVVNVAVLLRIEGAKIMQASITLGSVAPTIIHAPSAENFLRGKFLDEATINQAADLARQASRSIDDVRGSRLYRDELVRVGVLRGLRAILRGEERLEFPEEPVLLWGQDYHGEAPALQDSHLHEEGLPIRTRINGKEYTFTSGQGKTLLRLLREEAGLIGTKEGCAEGECGACTVFLDGAAVMSCLVPAPRAEGAEIVTIEGLAQDGNLHPVQQGFIQEGAVQCGYCTPGFVMAAAKLLEEKPAPDREQVRQAITGNLCRCTGYYMIVSAIERAAQLKSATSMEVLDG